MQTAARLTDRIMNIFRRKKDDASASRRNTTPAEPELTEEEKAEDLKFYMEQIYLLIKPVICCILLAILWVKLTRVEDDYYDTSTGQLDTGGQSISIAYGISPGTGGAAVTTSIVSALAILGEIVGATIVIVLLFYFGCMKILYGFFVLVVLALLGLFGFTLGSDLLSVHNLALDHVTFWFFIWNLAAVGVALIFYKGPMFLQQIYLVVMSSLMAFSLTQLPALTTWILLALLAVWDLIAVLCPFGPLRILVETSRNENREIPALLYTAMVWMMASPGTPPSSRSADNTETIAVPARAYTGPPSRSGARISDPPSEYGDERELTDTSRRWSNADADTPPPVEQPNSIPSPANGTIPAVTAAAADVEDEEEEESTGLKLGLGDFVFYSVLVARAAMFDWVTTAACTVAVMTGMNMTIFLLAIYQKALPALPISIAFGILFYFVSAVTLTPFATSGLMNRTERVTISGWDSGLWVGKGGGGGMIYV
ncbi:Presenilin-2 [Borealophlyctis nickersoniae]|nr:Presenilin-2 [Borealophlyctis nickersoniae]